MDKSLTFNDIFKSSFLEKASSFSILDTFIALTLALAIGMFIFIYIKRLLMELCILQILEPP